MRRPAGVRRGQGLLHDAKQLVDAAGLRSALDADAEADPELQANWDVVKDWSEASRYVRTAKVKAQQMYHAVTHKRHGVLSWIKARW